MTKELIVYVKIFKLLTMTFLFLLSKLLFSQIDKTDLSGVKDLWGKNFVQVEGNDGATACGILLSIKDGYAYILTVHHTFGIQSKDECHKKYYTVNIKFPLSELRTFKATQCGKISSKKDYIIYKSVNTVNPDQYQDCENMIDSKKNVDIGASLTIVGIPHIENEPIVKSVIIRQSISGDHFFYTPTSNDKPIEGDSGGLVLINNSILIGMHQKEDTESGIQKFRGLFISSVYSDHPDLSKYNIESFPLIKKDINCRSYHECSLLSIKLANDIRDKILTSDCNDTIKLFYEKHNIKIKGNYEKKGGNYTGEIHLFVNNIKRLVQKFKGKNDDYIIKKLHKKLYPRLGLEKRRRPIILLSAITSFLYMASRILYLNAKNQQSEEKYYESVSPKRINKHTNRINQNIQEIYCTAMIVGYLSGISLIEYRKKYYYKNDLTDNPKR